MQIFLRACSFPIRHVYVLGLIVLRLLDEIGRHLGEPRLQVFLLCFGGVFIVMSEHGTAELDFFGGFIMFSEVLGGVIISCVRLLAEWLRATRFRVVLVDAQLLCVLSHDDLRGARCQSVVVQPREVRVVIRVFGSNVEDYCLLSLAQSHFCLL